MENKEINDILQSAQQTISTTINLHQLLHEVRAKYFGNDSVIAKLTNSIREEKDQNIKKSTGLTVKALRDGLEALISKRVNELKAAHIRDKLAMDRVDGSVSVPRQSRGTIHPITFASKEILDIFRKYGCTILSGPEIETTWYNFDALNVLSNHPARNMQDTFYLDGKDNHKENYLLRTHTTAVDIKALKTNKPPFKGVAFGKTFRRDLDKTHSPMFHQIDFLEVSEDANVSQLKSVIMLFLKEFFNTNKVEIRMRPSFFPFTEPSIEVDIMYSVKDGKIVLDTEGDQYMEVLGCGVLRPVVLKNCDIDSNKHTAIAAGIGVERMAMLKYGIEDIRHFYHSDIKWLDSHFFLNNI